MMYDVLAELPKDNIQKHKKMVQVVVRKEKVVKVERNQSSNQKLKRMRRRKKKLLFDVSVDSTMRKKKVEI